MSSDDDFCLKWNDHHTTFFASAETLCRSNALTDVTLSTGKREFPAHKLVLSVCSGYFNHLFAGSPEKSGDSRKAIVYLKDVDPRHLELLLSYMYRGEINVQESELMGFLATAKSLQVKGLTDADANEEAEIAPQSSNNQPLSTAPPRIRTPKQPPKLLPGVTNQKRSRTSPLLEDSGGGEVKRIKDEKWNEGRGTLAPAATASSSSLFPSTSGGAPSLAVNPTDSNNSGGYHAPAAGDFDTEYVDDDADVEYPVPEGDDSAAIYDEQGDPTISTVGSVYVLAGIYVLHVLSKMASRTWW